MACTSALYYTVNLLEILWSIQAGHMGRIHVKIYSVCVCVCVCVCVWGGGGGVTNSSAGIFLMIIIMKFSHQSFDLYYQVVLPTKINLLNRRTV